MIEPTRRGFAQLCAAGAAMGQGRRDPGIVKAMEAVTAAMGKAESDPMRPVYHFHPPAQWNNDPNGTIFYRGWHHMFYQLNPYDSVWGHMHWGHARSRDMVNWEHLPIALGPSLDKGEEHIFSGGAVLAADGKPRLIYTSIGKRDPEQWLAIPKDEELIEWEKYAGNPILDMKIHGGKKVGDWRDPFMFRAGGKTHMVCGGNGNMRKQGGGGQVQLYVAATPDLTAWKHLGVVFEDRNSETINLECPNLFPLGGKWVLLTSPHKPCEYFVGDLDVARVRFTPTAHGVLDPGNSYASNISYDDKGRCILWLWGRTETKVDKGWNGCMAMPRILSIGADGLLRQDVPGEFAALRGEMKSVAGADLGEKALVLSPAIAGDCLEIEAVFSAQGASAVGLRVRGKTEVSFNPKDGVLTVGGVKKLLGIGQPVKLRVFLDKRVMEVYANDGQAAVFTVVEGGAADTAVEAFAKGGRGRLESLKAWGLRGARFSLERFL